MLLLEQLRSNRPTGGRRPDLKRLRLILGGVAFACLTGVAALESAPPDPRPLFESALHAGAVRLATLQRQDGTWPRGLSGGGDLAQAGRPARALLAANAVLHDPRLELATRRTARTLGEALGRNPAAATSSNLLFLADHAALAGDTELRARVAGVWHGRLLRAGLGLPAASARELATRSPPTAWDEGAWQNYLLWQAGEVADLARSLGESGWADEFTLAMAEAYAPRRHHDWCALAAGRMFDALSRVEAPEARRLEQAHHGMLREDELAPGLPWNDTPHDSWVHVPEAAVAVHGLLASRDPADRKAAREGLALLSLRQAATGGWGATATLLDYPVDPTSHDFVPDAQLGIEESAATDADMVFALARALD